MYKKIPDREQLQARAAILSAEDELSDTEIARRCGITRRTLMRWKKQPAMQQKTAEHLRLSKQRCERQMISERHKRIADVNVRWKGLQDIILERSNSPEMQGVPGGSTGLLRQRPVSFRRDGVVKMHYEVDRTLLKEMCHLEVAAARALGQWEPPKYQPTALPGSRDMPSGRQHRTAMLIANGTKSDLEIATACRINRRTLARWKEQPSFRTRVAEVRARTFGDPIL
jgi:hypothetical protein